MLALPLTVPYFSSVNWDHYRMKLVRWLKRLNEIINVKYLVVPVNTVSKLWKQTGFILLLIYSLVQSLRGKRKPREGGCGCGCQWGCSIEVEDCTAHPALPPCSVAPYLTHHPANNYVCNE